MPVVIEPEIALSHELIAQTEGTMGEPSRKGGGLLGSWLRVSLATIVLFFVIVTFFAQGFSVYGSCMEPNIRTGERVLGNKLIYRFKPPVRGDVVVFSYPGEPSSFYIKRIVGMPGETIYIHNGLVYINDKYLPEYYLVNTPHGDFGPERIQPGTFFVMGDFRDASDDSRHWGDLPARNIRAKAWVRYWPMSRLDVMR